MTLGCVMICKAPQDVSEFNVQGCDIRVADRRKRNDAGFEGCPSSRGAVEPHTDSFECRLGAQSSSLHAGTLRNFERKLLQASAVKDRFRFTREQFCNG
jgi:hypothetical protein